MASSQELTAQQRDMAVDMLKTMNDPAYEQERNDEEVVSSMSSLVVRAAHNGLALSEQTIDRAYDVFSRHKMTKEELDKVIGDFGSHDKDSIDEQFRYVHLAAEVILQENGIDRQMLDHEERKATARDMFGEDDSIDELMVSTLIERSMKTKEYTQIIGLYVSMFREIEPRIVANGHDLDAETVLEFGEQYRAFLYSDQDSEDARSTVAGMSGVELMKRAHYAHVYGVESDSDAVIEAFDTDKKFAEVTLVPLTDFFDAVDEGKTFDTRLVSAEDKDESSDDQTYESSGFTVKNRSDRL